MEEIDFSQLFNYFKSKVIYILFAMSIMFCASSIYVNRFRTPEYTSSTTILLNQASNETISSNDINLNNSLITTYSEIIKSKRVLRQVIEILGSDMQYDQLAGMVSVSEIPSTSIIRISVTSTDSKLASEIANTTADVFAEEIVNIYNIENLSIIDQAEETNRASSSSSIKLIIMATMVGGVLSVLAIFIIFYFDTTVKNEEDIEKVTGLPVIGVVPVSREKIKASQHRKYYEDSHRKHIQEEMKPLEHEIRHVQKNDDLVKVNQEEVSKIDLPATKK